jgi:predicted DNA-binding transcriptional regulator AlpA
VTELRAVDLAECCRRLGISRRTGERLIREGRFPIPELPRLGQEGSVLPRRTYSTADIDRYLDTAATSERRARPYRVVGARRR